MFSNAAIGTAVDQLIGSWRRVACTCILGLVICLMGCQPQVQKAAPLPPPLPPAVPLRQPVRPTFYVAINQLNLRACPGLDCANISVLELNAEVEKLGEIESWTQIRVKKNGTIGYVRSRYLSPHPVKVAKPAKKTKKAKLTKKKTTKAKPPSVAQPPEAPAKEEEAGPQKPEPSPPLPKAM